MSIKIIVNLSLLLMLTGCAAKSSNEMEEISRDILKSNRGIEIEVKPLEKGK